MSRHYFLVFNLLLLSVCEAGTGLFPAATGSDKYAGRHLLLIHETVCSLTSSPFDTFIIYFFSKSGLLRAFMSRCII
jgi:hypothetical protein